MAVILLIVKDICGIICAMFTWLLVLYAEFVVMRIILLPSSYTIYRNINAFIWQTLALLALISHLRTMFTDPVSLNFIPRHFNTSNYFLNVKSRFFKNFQHVKGIM